MTKKCVVTEKQTNKQTNCVRFIPGVHTAARAVKWTWYKGLRLVWNAASRFCHARGGNLPVLGTHLSMDAMRAAGRTYFNSTDKEL